MARLPKTLGILFVASVMAGTTAAAVTSPTAQPLELAVKATFLPKFMAYVTWPPSTLPPSEAVQICVIGRDPFGAKLDEAVAGQRVDQHPLVVRRLQTIESAGGCRLAFVGGSAGQSAAAALKVLQGSAVLTVTDARLGAARGIVHFDLKGGRVGFHIDDAGAASKDLTISSRLLSLALTVKPRERPR
jgi:hypothetical protein